MINREGYYDNGVERECTNCGKIHVKNSKTVTLCPKCNSERVKSYGSPEYKLWNRAKTRCKKSGLEFSIEIEDIKIPEFCPYLDLPLVIHKGSPGGKPNSPALDRIDNRLGYTKNNIQVISHLANQMKASATPDQLILFSQRILETFGKGLTHLV